MQTKEVNATKGGAVANKKIELEIVKVIENPMAELESLDEREKGIVDVVKKSVSETQEEWLLPFGWKPFSISF